MRLGRLRDRPESPACPLPLSGERSPLPFGRSLRRPQFGVGEVGALEHRVMGEMPGASVGEAIAEIKPGRVMERPAGRAGWAFERGPAEKLPAGNFLGFSFLQALRWAGGGFQQAPLAIRPERLKAESCRPATWPTAIYHGVVEWGKISSFGFPKPAAATPRLPNYLRGLSFLFDPDRTFLAFNADFRRRRSRQANFKVHSES